jgi:hypothetical protein
MTNFMPQGRFRKLAGSVSNPQMGGLRLVLALVSEAGTADSPTHKAMDKKWVNIKQEVKGWKTMPMDFKLGNLKTTAVQSDVWVVNALVKKADGTVDAVGLDTAVKKLTVLAKAEQAAIHMTEELLAEVPALKDLLQKLAIENGINVYLYT